MSTPCMSSVVPPLARSRSWKETSCRLRGVCPLRGRPPPSLSFRACVLFQRVQCPPTAASSCGFQSHSAGRQASPYIRNPDTLYAVLQTVSSGPTQPGCGPMPRRPPTPRLLPPCLSPLCASHPLPRSPLPSLCVPSSCVGISVSVSPLLSPPPRCHPTPFPPSLAEPNGPSLCPVGVQPG